MSDRIPRLNAALEGRYRIESELGEGGMATVYLAHDVRHERQVALKVLRPELAAVVGAERFLAEIKTTAHLQHPNILPLFDSGEADGVLFYVMPYVRGETLRQRLDRERQLPVDEAVKIAVDVAGALDYAHREGVIHRDIKPANILLHDGRPVISDFGIALAMGTGAAGRLTETGLSLGTPHYMSPEQAAGDEAVGAASDVYALGCMLYETLAGSPPFVGSTAQSILAKIVTSDAEPVTLHRRSVPANVEAAIRRCLEKVPADRFPSAGALAVALEDEHFRYGMEEGAATAQSRVGWVAALLALLVGVGIGAGALSFLKRPAQAQPLTFIELPPPGTRFLQAPKVSPDGRTLAMLVTDPATEAKIWVRSLGSEDARPVEGTGGARGLIWSPDSKEIVYQVRGELRRVTLSSGGPQLVAPLTITAGTWMPDGQLVVANHDGIALLPAAGGAPRTLVKGGRYSDLDLVAGGPQALFVQFGGETGIHALNLSTGEQKLLVPGGTSSAQARYVAPDLFVYVTDRVLMGQRIRLSDMSLVGDPFPIERDIGDHFFAGSSSGALSFVRGTSGEQRLAWFDRKGDTLGYASPKGLYSEVHLSRQGTRMMFVRADSVTGNLDLWVQDLARGTPPNRFTTDDDVDHLAVFSPDGKEIAWEAHAGGKLNLMRRATDGSAAATFVTTWGRAGGADDWSPDGRFVLYWAEDPNTGGNIWAVPMQGDAKPFPLIESTFNESDARFSPDGHWLAYASDASGQDEIYLQRIDEMKLVGGPVRVSDGGGVKPQWRADGKELFFLSGTRLMSTDIGSDPDHPANTPKKLFDLTSPELASNYAVAPDGQRFLAIVSGGTATTGSAVVTLNWSAGVEKR